MGGVMICKGQRAAIFGLLLAGQTIGQTANILGVSPPTVRRQITDDWVPRRKRRSMNRVPYTPSDRTRTDYDAVVLMHDNGRRTLQEVGDHFGITRERVRQILAKRGLMARNNGTLPPEVLADRLSRYLKALKPGVSSKEALDSVGLVYGEVAMAANALGYTLPKPTRKERIRYREIAAYYDANQHLTGLDVAKHFDVDPNTVSRALRKMGVTPRHKGWTHKFKSNADAPTDQGQLEVMG